MAAARGLYVDGWRDQESDQESDHGVSFVGGRTDGDGRTDVVIKIIIHVSELFTSAQSSPPITHQKITNKRHHPSNC